MITVKVTFHNGATLTTNINASFEFARKYYLGNVFNVGIDSDVLVKAIKVERL